MRPRSLALFLAVLLPACAGVGSEPLPGQPAHHVNRGFRNLDPEFERPGAWTRWSFLARRAWVGLTAPRRIDLPVEPNDGRALRASGTDPTLTWVGHSTLLIQLDGVNLLTDPQWGVRASPLSWIGPRRLTPPGLAFERLPPIHVVLISHDHYDHLDLGTVRRLAETHDPLFIVPLGLRRWFADNGMTRVEELDWWQTYEHRGLRLACLPAQHWSQRTPWDRNRRLWGSWAVLGSTRRLYFGGDSGYFDGFKAAAERFGPFDVAALAIGTYMPPSLMRLTHTTPEQAVQAFLDLGARVIVPIHWGTFDLGEEPLDEPPTRLLAEVRRRGIEPDRAWLLKHGETRRW